MTATGQTAMPARAEALLPRVYDDVPERMHAMATRSIKAHLLKLRQDGRAAEAQGAWQLAQSVAKL